MSSVRKASLVLMILAVALTACANGLATSTPVDANSISTSLVGTLVVSLFQTQTARVTPTPTSTKASPTAINTLALPTNLSSTPTSPYYLTLGTLTPIFTPSVTGTVYTPTIDPGSLAYGCNNLAFVRDVTIPPGTVLSPDEDFAKTWKVANTGTCNWMYQYALVLVSGNPFSGKTTKLNRIVSVGHWAEVSVEMGAPHAFGAYTSYWRMTDADGHMFGEMLPISLVVGVDSTNTPEPPADTQTPTSASAPEPTATP